MTPAESRRLQSARLAREWEEHSTRGRAHGAVSYIVGVPVLVFLVWALVETGMKVFL